MRHINKQAIFFVALIIGYSLSIAQDVKTIKKEFDNKKEVEINSVSGDCIIEKGTSDKIVVEVEYDVSPEGSFTPEFSERANSIKIKERWSGSSSGHVTWNIKVPPGTEVEFSSASGDLSIHDLSASVDASTASGDIVVEDSKGKIDISTASGDIKLSGANGKLSLSTASGDIKANKVSGDIELSTASGDITVKNSAGEFDLSCASGDIEANGIKLTEEGSFSVASGDVEITLSETSEYDIEISSASGDAILDYNGNELKGYFELTSRKDRGRIEAPRAFDNEEEFERNGRAYERKSFSVGGKSPKVLIDTASGKAILKK